MCTFFAEVEATVAASKCDSKDLQPTGLASDGGRWHSMVAMCHEESENNTKIKFDMLGVVTFKV